MPATKPSPQTIPPRALRSDVPGGTMWVPRWKWAGRLFGREVRFPATVRVTKETPDVQAAPPDTGDTALPSVKPQTTSAPEEDRTERSEDLGQWARPLLAILGVLVATWALGVSFGYVLARGTPTWMAGGRVEGILGALLLAPSGALLLLLAALGCFVQAADEDAPRRVWQAGGWGLVCLFALVLFSGLLP